MKRWFFGGAEVDTEIKTNFSEDLTKLNQGEYDEWKQDRDGKLAAVILADQFTRNIFRKQKEAFDFDHISLGIVKSITEDEFFSYAVQE